MKQLGYWFTPEHADEDQLQKFRNRCILHSSAQAVAEHHDIRIGLPQSAIAIDAIASQLLEDIDPCAQTLSALSAWFHENQ